MSSDGSRQEKRVACKLRFINNLVWRDECHVTVSERSMLPIRLPLPSRPPAGVPTRRLRQARRAAGLSLRGLAAAMGGVVTPQALGKYERGESNPSPRVMAALVRALRTSEEVLRGEPLTATVSAEFRSKVPVGARLRATIQAAALQRMEAYGEIEARLGLGTTAWDRPQRAPYSVDEDGADVDMAAELLRRHWGLGSRPISNLAEVLEEHGVKVAVFDLPSGIDGASIQANTRDRKEAAVIVAGARGPKERQRFTMAHELGHLLLRCRLQLDVEKIAHRFAAAFLMPAETVWAEVGRHRAWIDRRELLELKRFFGVSAQALTRRCATLDAFRPRLVRTLLTEFADRGWSTPPYREAAETSGVERSTRFRRLCLRAVAEEAISRPRAAALLALAGENRDPPVAGYVAGLTEGAPRLARRRPPLDSARRIPTAPPDRSRSGETGRYSVRRSGLVDTGLSFPP